MKGGIPATEAPRAGGIPMRVSARSASASSARPAGVFSAGKREPCRCCCTTWVSSCASRRREASLVRGAVPGTCTVPLAVKASALIADACASTCAPRLRLTFCGAEPAVAATAARTSAGTACELARAAGTGSRCAGAEGDATGVDGDESRADRDTSSTSGDSADSVARTDSRGERDCALSAEGLSVDEPDSEVIEAGAEADPESADARR